MEFLLRANPIRIWLVLACLLATGCASSPSQKYNEALATGLLQLAERDQAARNAAAGNAKDTNLRGTIQRIDRENRQELQAMIGQFGWPGRALVGETGAHAAWLVAQHADDDPAFQKQCLKLMEAMPDGEVSRQDLAYLTDRVLLASGKKQRYGTQFQQVGRRFLPQPMEDIKKVDARRRKIGLPPLAQYARELQEFYGNPAGEK